MKHLRIRTGLAVGLLSLSFSACNDAGTILDTPANTTLVPTAPTEVTPPPTFEAEKGFSVTVSTSPNYVYTLHNQTSVTTKCTVLPGDSNKDITCLLEADELDLWFNSFTLYVNAPTSMCPYFESSPYYYYNLPPGYGPTLVNRNEATNTTTCNYPDGSTNVPCSGTCAYDYTSIFGPNCCVGKYTLIVQGTDPTTPPSVTDSDWSGNPTSCLMGPAMDSQPKSRGGYPLPYIIQNTAPGIMYNYDVAAPSKKGLGMDVFVANYFDPALYGVNVPKAMRAQTSYGLTISSATEPYYRFTCFDVANDVLARIKIQVRKWNQKSELANFLAGGAGNPDTFGKDPVFNYQLDRRFGWNTGGNGEATDPDYPASLINLYPGE